jgi:hypothetical protein
MHYYNCKNDCGPAITCFFILILAILTFSPAYAQKSSGDTPPLRERLFFGGNFGLQFGTITDIELAPVVGLWVLPRLAVAAGPNYRFFKNPYSRTAIFGANGYVQYHFIKDINSILPAGIHMGFFLHVEDEILSLQTSFWKSQPDATDRFFVNTVLGGAGISQPMGMKSSLNLIFLWAVTENSYDIYGNPEVRISFIF